MTDVAGEPSSTLQVDDSVSDVRRILSSDGAIDDGIAATQARHDAAMAESLGAATASSVEVDRRTSHDYSVRPSDLEKGDHTTSSVKGSDLPVDKLCTPGSPQQQYPRTSGVEPQARVRDGGIPELILPACQRPAGDPEISIKGDETMEDKESLRQCFAPEKKGRRHSIRKTEGSHLPQPSCTSKQNSRLYSKHEYNAESTTDDQPTLLPQHVPLVREHSGFISLRRDAGESSGRSPDLVLETDSDSDESSKSSCSEDSKQLNISNGRVASDAMEWQRSTEGIARMAEVAAATISTAPTRAIRTSKYLKLFAPAHSGHDTFPVLAALHKRMNGQGWQRRGGWGSYLVRKSQAELDDGRVYGVKSKEGNVELLMLASNNMCGRIPAIVARLGSLKCINFAENHITGCIPAELGLLLQLQTLQLQSNNLRDGISPLLGSLISLVRLSLSNNKLTGPLPDSLGNLVHLQFLSLEHNRFTGGIPDSLCELPALETLNASNNRLEGTIPQGIGGLRVLKKLDLGHNLLTGEIPLSMCTLRFLVWLRLDENQLTGPVPARLGDLSNLLILNLCRNKLSSNVPPALGTLADLISVNLRGNSLEGPFPFPAKFEMASRVGGLRRLDLGNNGLEAPFPELTGLPELQTLSLDNNQMFGPLRADLPKACGNLFQLYLQNNRLTGEIPPSLGELSKLEVLNLSGNSFEGGLPSELESLHALRSLSASRNALNGGLPAFLGGMSLLTSIALDGNNFTGGVPPELGMLSDLRRLYLERNNLVGPIPAELSNCLQLEELYLHQNKLEGKIPEAFRQLVELRYLYLHQNCLVGPVPEWLGMLSHLRGLILGDNKLRGHIPWQLGHLHEVRKSSLFPIVAELALQDLYLNDNCLEGRIPERLGHCDRLQRLHLERNRLTGRVPRYLRHVRDLRELNLERNNLHGEVPIPLFLKPSLGPNACGFKFGDNPGLVDSRAHFATTVAGLQCVGSAVIPQQSAKTEQHFWNDLSPLQTQSSRHRISVQSFPSMRHLSERSVGSDRNLEGMREGGGVTEEEGWGGSEEMIRGEGTASACPRVFDVEDGQPKYGGAAYAATAAAGGKDWVDCGRPWDSSEDVSYFLLTVVAGNALAALDYLFAARLYDADCGWGAMAIVAWKVVAGMAGLAATRKLGYGCKWQTLATVRLAMPMQARICFSHSCESDLFQALQQVEWHWHAMLQLVTQLAAALACEDRGPAGYELWLPLTIKALVVGVVCMQRLDGRRMYRAGQESGPTTSTVAAKFRPFFRDSAFARIFMVGYHMAELGARAIPVATVSAAFARGGPFFCLFFTVLAVLPGMTVRWFVRWKGGLMSRRGESRDSGVYAEVKRAMALSLALDSEFGPATLAHVLAVMVTTIESSVLTSLASSFPRPYSSVEADALVTVCTFMLIYTWVVLALEVLLAFGLAPPPPAAAQVPAPLPPPRLSVFSSSRALSALSASASSSRSLLFGSARQPSSLSRSLRVRPPPTSIDVISGSHDVDSGSVKGEDEITVRGATSAGSSVVIPMEA